MSDWHNRSHCNRTHVDEGVLRVLYGDFGCRSLLDVGCGPGGQVALAQSCGISARGVDGDPDVGAFYTHDFLEGPFCPKRDVDAVWCNEFLEHIPEDKLENVRPCFEACKYAVITAHPPTGKDIPFHFNEQGDEYWVAKMAEWGLSYGSASTSKIRRASTMERDFVRKNGLVFYR